MAMCAVFNGAKTQKRKQSNHSTKFIYNMWIFPFIFLNLMIALPKFKKKTINEYTFGVSSSATVTVTVTVTIITEKEQDLIDPPPILHG